MPVPVPRLSKPLAHPVYKPIQPGNDTGNVNPSVFQQIDPCSSRIADRASTLVWHTRGVDQFIAVVEEIEASKDLGGRHPHW